MNREQLFAIFFFAVFLYLLYQAFRIFAPFLQPIAWGAVLALTFFPLHRRLTDALAGRDGLSAALLTVTLVVVVVVPTILFGSVILAQAGTLYQRLTDALSHGSTARMTEWIEASPVGGLWRRVAPWVEPYDINLAGLVRNTLRGTWKVLADQLAGTARNLVIILFNCLVGTMTFFVSLRAGPRFVQQVRDMVPMEREHTDAVLSTLFDTISAVVQAMLVTAVAQGLLAGIGYWISGLPFSLFLGVLSGFLSLIPYAVPLVWMSCAGYLFVIGSTGSAIFLAIWGLAVIGSVDNVIRPLVIGERAKLSAFLLFFAILGGLSVYGFLGLLLGPVLVATVVTFLRIYRAEYVDPQPVSVADVPSDP
jgi:predicted PurR-regulated permease PerM